MRGALLSLASRASRRMIGSRQISPCHEFLAMVVGAVVLVLILVLVLI